MKMPEGYERLKSDERKLDASFGAYYDLQGGIEEALDLIKEMAEALEYVARGPKTDDSDATVAKQVLKKFEEWK